jgi:hypothetical protein
MSGQSGGDFHSPGWQDCVKPPQEATPAFSFTNFREGGGGGRDSGYPMPSRTRMMRGHVLLGGSGRPCLPMAQRKRSSASAMFSRGVAASTKHAPNPISSIRSHTILLIRVRESPRVDCLRRHFLHHKLWIQSCHLTAAPLADRLEASYRR